MATREELLAELSQLRNNEKALLQTELNQLQQQESTLSANKPYNFGSAFEQFASGGMEGLGELTGMMGDVAEASPYLNPITAAVQYPIDKLMGALGVQSPDRFSMDNAKNIRDIVTENVQPYDPKYRYSRKAGEFVVPGLVTAPLSGMGYARSAVTDLAGAIGAQGTKDMGYGDVGQLVGTVGAAGLTDLGISTAKSLKRNLLGLSQPEIDASAAYVLKELGLTSEQVDQAIKTLPKDKLAEYATLAEVTQNPNVAKVQQEYTSGVGPGASRWQGLEKDRARLRDSVLAKLSTETPPNPEGFGRQIIDAVSENKKGLQEEAKTTWQKFPRGKPVNTNALKRKVMSELSSRQGGGYKSSGFVHPKVKELTDQILEAGEDMTTGQLQDIRSRALTLKREVKLDGRDIGLLDDIQGGVIKSIEGELGNTRNLPPQEAWKSWGALTNRELLDQAKKAGVPEAERAYITRPDMIYDLNDLLGSIDQKYPWAFDNHMKKLAEKTGDNRYLEFTDPSSDLGGTSPYAHVQNEIDKWLDSPAEFFHGTSSDFKRFKKGYGGIATGAQSARKATFVSNAPADANDYANLISEALPEAHSKKFRAIADDMGNKFNIIYKGLEDAGASKNALYDELIKRATKILPRLGDTVGSPEGSRLVQFSKQQALAEIIDIYKKHSPEKLKGISPEILTAYNRGQRTLKRLANVSPKSPHAPNIKPVRIRTNSPLTVNKKGKGVGDLTKNITKAEQQGRDAVIFYDIADPHPGATHIASLTPETSIRTRYDTPKIKDPNALTPQDEQIWKTGRDLTKEIDDTFGGRTLGSKILRPDARESKILDKILDGDASTIKEFKKLVKNDPTIIEKAKAGIVDKIPRAAGNLLTPAKLETFIKQNRRGLKELYGKDGIRTMERVLGDLQSQTNIGNMARGASKGGSDTAVRLNTLSEIRSMVGSRGKTRWPIVGEKLDALTKGAKENARKKIDSLILESMFDPQFASDLLKTPTQSRVLSIVDRLLETAESMGVAAARPGVLEFFNGERPTGGSTISINEADTYPTAGGEAYGGGGAGGTPAGKVPEPVPQATPTPITLTRQQLRSDPKALKTYVKSLDPVLQAIINVESRGNPKAVSHAGAKGIMQLMPRNLRVFGVKDPFDPYESIQAGIKLLNEEVGRFGGDIKLVLAAYNAGSPAVNRAIKKAGSKSWSAIYPHLPAETKKYVPKVLNELRKMEA